VSAGGARPQDTFVLRGPHVLDEQGSFSGPLDVAVEDGWIAAVGPNLSRGDGPDLDLAGAWLMPGVFDCHDHVALSSIEPMELLQTPITQWTLETARNLRRTLECGVTYVRDASGADAGIRTSVERGYVPGPELSVSVVALTETGGHLDGFLAGPGLEMPAEYAIPDYPGRPPYRVDGPEEMRAAVRQLLRAGADWIKLCTTGGVLSAHDEALEPQFTPAEIQMAVQEAARRGRGVMVHALGGEGLDNAIAAGVRSIEHGIHLTESQADAMAKAGCHLVPTLAILEDVLAWAAAGKLPAYAAEKAALLEGRVGAAVAVARAHDVPIALGTDFLHRDEHGGNLRELALMRRAGLTPEETLLAATANGARLCGVSERLGRIVPGLRFDAIVLEEDPGDLTLFESPDAVKAVFKAGRLVRGNEPLAELGELERSTA
jgi:imidazolonepropionase-like amidohydrolase